MPSNCSRMCRRWSKLHSHWRWLVSGRSRRRVRKPLKNRREEDGVAGLHCGLRDVAEGRCRGYPHSRFRSLHSRLQCRRSRFHSLIAASISSASIPPSTLPFPPPFPPGPRGCSPAIVPEFGRPLLKGMRERQRLGAKRVEDDRPAAHLLRHVVHVQLERAPSIQPGRPLPHCRPPRHTIGRCYWSQHVAQTVLALVPCGA